MGVGGLPLDLDHSPPAENPRLLPTTGAPQLGVEVSSQLLPQSDLSPLQGGKVRGAQAVKGRDA